MIRFTLPLPPNLANARMHWAVRNKHRADYELSCFAHLMRQKVKREKAVPMYSARGAFGPVIIDATLYTWSPMDWDNLYARLKWAVDAIVKYGLLANDDPTHLTLGVISQQVDRKHRRIEVTLR